MLKRTHALQDPVTLYLDGTRVIAERGEPVAVALLASDHVTLARSPKLHRPRAPSCLRGACDGCLARVNGVPNVMTCLVPAQGEERIETQNVIGSRKLDLLRVTDWFFPKGIDHHHLMAGIPGARDVMQSLARKVAGLGKLPSTVELPHDARWIDADAAVIGAGPSGIIVASRLASKGLQVVLVDDGLVVGGSLCAIPDLRDKLLAEYPLGQTQVLCRSVAAGVYLGQILVAGQAATVVRAPVKVFATGAHDGVLAAINNDLPGVFSARALGRLLAYGVEPTGPVALVGNGFWAEQLTGMLGNKLVVHVPAESLEAIHGSSHVKGIEVSGGDCAKTKQFKATVVAIAAPCAPCFEVASQAGAQIQYDPTCGYAVVVDENGRTGDHLWAVGECTGQSFDIQAMTNAAHRVVQDIMGK